MLEIGIPFVKPFWLESNCNALSYYILLEVEILELQHSSRKGSRGGFMSFCR